MEMSKDWKELSSEEKRKARFQRWLSPPNVAFASARAENDYKKKVGRFIAVMQLQLPDRVPLSLSTGFFPAYYYGITPEKAMYDPEEVIQAWRKFIQDFEMDTLSSPTRVLSGRVLEILDYKMYRWAGHGVSPDSSFQYVEDEYMKADEYDALLQDPSNFWMRIYLPRVFGALAPLRKLLPLTDLIEMPFVMSNIAAYGKPEVQEALLSLLKAGKEAAKWLGIVGKFNEEMACSGLPRLYGGMVKAPFDTIGDTLRGTQGIIKDMFRQRSKVMEAMERLVPLEIQRGVSAANASDVPTVLIPLHKGADGFMSARQFEMFYWLPLKKVVLGLIEEGIVPILFAEGGYNTRLDMVKDLPRGGVIWHFDRTDMVKAKEILGDSACLMGNIPVSLLYAGTPAGVKEYCKNLMERAGKGGGFILSSGAGIDEAKPENLQAVIDSVKEYGVYG